MKFHGIHQSQSGSTTVSTIREASIASPSRRSPAPASTSTKKRKLDKFAETTSNLNTDDDEGLGDIKAESSTTVKAEVVKAERIKDEHNVQESIADSTTSTNIVEPNGAFQYTFDSAMGFNGIHDSAMFDDFLRCGGSIPPNYEFQSASKGDQSDGAPASMNMNPATGSRNGHGMHESILITD